MSGDLASEAPSTSSGAHKMSAAEWRRNRARQWRKPAGYFRTAYREWFELPQMVALPASARLIFQWGWAMSGGQYDVPLPASAAAGSLGICERTFRRSMASLVESGLVELTHTGGGAHDNPHRFRFLALDQDYRPSGRAQDGPPVRVAEWAATRTAGKKPPTKVEQDAPKHTAAPAIEERSPSTPTPPAAGATVATAITPKLMSELVIAHADSTFGDPAEIRVQLGAYREDDLLALARHYGLLEGAPTSSSPARAAAVPSGGIGLARHIVADFLRLAEVRRDPTAMELAQAQLVVKHAGTDAWRLYQDAVANLAALIRGGKAKQPRWFSYLAPHLQKVGALPLRAPDDQAVPEGDRPPPGI